MILTDREIRVAIHEEQIIINPAPRPECYSSTAVDLTLANFARRWTEKALDAWAHALVRAVRGRVQVIECESEWQSPAWWDGEITIGDAFPAEPICPSPAQFFFGSVDLMVRLARGEPDAFQELEEIQQEVTRFKIEAARSAGCSAIHFGPTYDWWPSPYPWQGLTRPDGTPRPVCDVIRGAQ